MRKHRQSPMQPSLLIAACACLAVAANLRSSSALTSPNSSSFSCPATSVVASHTTRLGMPLGTFNTTRCASTAASSTYAHAPAYSTPPAGQTGQLAIGNGNTSLRNSTNLVVTGIVACTLSDGTNTTCLALRSNAQPDHPAGPWCSGGNWNNTVVNYSSIAVNCNCERNSCTSTCNDICLECPLANAGTPYLIPTNPSKAASAVPANGDNNVGDAIALNGVPLARADPLTMLAQANNPAPLDWYGGHATLQYIYHYHAIPTYRFNCSSGWDSYAHVWASAAPDAKHSQQIGWALDGYPLFGPFSINGSVPTDTDSCYGHAHSPFGYHYHARDVHDGKTHAFLGCFKGKRAVQAFDSSSSGGGTEGGPGNGTSGGELTNCSAATVPSGTTQRCCGDRVCDGPETLDNCPADCSPSSSSPSGRSSPLASPSMSPRPAGGSSPTGLAATACAAGTTHSGVSQRCCGDGVCDGPENPSSCASDCTGSNMQSPTTQGPGPGGPGPGGPGPGGPGPNGPGPNGPGPNGPGPIGGGAGR